MDSYQKFGLVSGQVLMGIVFGVGGAIVTALLGTIYEELTGNYIGDLSAHIMYSLYGGYVGMQIGIGFIGYKYVNKKGIQKRFTRFFVQSVVGLVLGLLIFYCYLSLFTFILPMVGAILGFDLALMKTKSKTVEKITPTISKK